MARKKVVVTNVVDEHGLGILRRGAEVVYLPQLPGRTLSDEIGEAHAILIRGATKISRNLLEKAENLLVIAKHGVGYDNIDVEAATGRGILVVNTPDANTESVAEHNLGLMLCLSKNICRADRELRQGKFAQREDLMGVELAGKGLGVVGLGRIGAELAEKCRSAFNMHIICYDPYVPKEKAIQLGFKQVERLDELLRDSDYVVISVPLTKSTTNLVGAKELALMKADAFLINSSRGGIVDEVALYDCLKQKRIAGAGLDVFLSEPPLPDNPLLGLENVVATPHLGAVTVDAMNRMATTAAEEIMRVLQGQRPKYPVNPEIYGK
jgi:D-3-phosphoglycerate dehydrogenase